MPRDDAGLSDSIFEGKGMKLALLLLSVVDDMMGAAAISPAKIWRVALLQWI